MNLPAEEPRPMTLLDLLQSVFRFRVRALMVATILMVLISAVVMLLPKRFDSDAKLLVRLGKSSVGLDPSATTGQIISLQESRESEMNSVIDMLESRRLAQDIVDTVGPERILEKHAWSEQMLDWCLSLTPELGGGSTPSPNAKMTAEELEHQKLTELAIKDLQSMLQVKLPRKATTVSITCRGRDPYLSQEIVQALIDSYQRIHISAYQSNGSLKFFEDKTREQEKLLAQTQEKLRSAKNEMMMITIHGKQESLQQQINENQKMQLDTHAELVSAKARVEELQKSLNALPTEIPTAVTSGIADASTDSMRARLYELEIQEQELSSKYSDEHPVLQKIRAQLSSSRKIFNDQQKDREQSIVASNPVRERQMGEVLSAQAILSGLEAKQLSLKETATELRDRLEKVNQFEIDSDVLQRKLDTARETYQIYSHKLEESRINQAMEAESVSNVSIVQEPSLILRHTSPRRGILFALGMVMAGLGGIAAAVVSEWLNRQANPCETREEYSRDEFISSGIDLGPREERIRIISKTS
jgi:polysaccharide biosynthesis protein PslE